MVTYQFLNEGMMKFLACPFCGFDIDQPDMADIIYPSGIYWREIDGVKHYVSHKEHWPTDNMCWQIVCNESMGGCDVTMTGDTIEEVINKWNRRA